MDLNRRTFLQATGAAASTVAAHGPVGMAASAGAKEAALATGNGPYLVVWDKGVLERCTNYHDAVRRASVLRHYFGIKTQHMRCTPGLFSQLNGNPGVDWIEVDGLAASPAEVKNQSFDLLRRARDPEQARRQLWHHHLNDLRTTVEQEDLNNPDTAYYARENGVIVAVASEHQTLLEGHDVTEWEIAPCSPLLANDLRAALDDETVTPPAINTSFARHMTEREYAERLKQAPRFRAGAMQPAEQRIAIESVGTSCKITVIERNEWLFAVEDENLAESQGPNDDGPALSRHLAAVVQANGFVMPGFWRTVQGIAHHLDAFADNAPPPSIAGKSTRHQNRHT